MVRCYVAWSAGVVYVVYLAGIVSGNVAIVSSVRCFGVVNLQNVFSARCCFDPRGRGVARCCGSLKRVSCFTLFLRDRELCSD